MIKTSKKQHKFQIMTTKSKKLTKTLTFTNHNFKIILTNSL